MLPFPDGVTRPAQYGASIQTQSVYMSQYQLIPYQRVAHYFRDQAGISISEGSVDNFNQRAYQRLEKFEAISRQQLMASPVLHRNVTIIIRLIVHY